MTNFVLIATSYSVYKIIIPIDTGLYVVVNISKNIFAKGTHIIYRKQNDIIQRATIKY